MINPVRSTTLPVVENSKHVKINKDRIKEIAKDWKKNGLPEPEWQASMHLEDSDEQTLLVYIFIVDTINFCFWTQKEEDRWKITYKGKREKGYFALSLALKDFFEKHPEKSNFEYFSTLSFDEFKEILQGGNNLQLLEERWDLVRSVSRTLLENYNGNPYKFIEEGRQKCKLLVPKIMEELKGFNDSVTYNGEKIYFLKRAQLLVSDIWGITKGRGVGNFDDLEYLAAFPDYKIPQILHHWGVFEYNPALEEKIRNRTLIAPGSREEIEIRSATVWGVEYMKEALQEEGIECTSYKIDTVLWNVSKRTSMPVPYHLTKTIFY